MSSARARLARVERIVDKRRRKPEMLILMVAPDDYPDPLPPNYLRKSEVEKRAAISSVGKLTACLGSRCQAIFMEP